MKTILKAFLLLAIPAVSFAQTNAIDSLSHLLKNEKRDTSRVRLLTKLTEVYRASRPDTALALAQQALSLAKKTGFVKGEAQSLNAMALIFLVTGNNPKALQVFLEALRKAEAVQAEKMANNILLNIGAVYSGQGDYRQCINYTIRGLAGGKRLHDQIAVNSCLANLGDSYEKLNMLDSALYYTNRAYDSAVKTNNVDVTGITLTNLGNIYSKMGKDVVAMDKYRGGLLYFQQEENDDALCEAYLGMAKLFQKSGNRDSALYYAKLSLAMGEKGGFTNRIMDASNFLTIYYTAIHNTDSAFAYQSATIAAKDSLFSQEKAREIQSLGYDESLRQQQIQDAKAEAQTQVKFNMLFGGLGTLLIVAFLLLRNNRLRKKANVVLTHQKETVESTLQELKLTQAQLVQSEKMASLGELTAGIAHEIQNPLNFVNNFSEVNKELIEELKSQKSKLKSEELDELLDHIAANEEKINHHGKRADAIVKGMLQHSRQSSGKKEPTDINALCDEYLRLSYHGFRAKDKNFNAEIKTDFDESIGRINIVPQDIGRVLLNLFNNAFYAVKERQRVEGESYKPIVSVQTKNENNRVAITVSDNGNGIPQNIIDKIFQPFFTTKPTGQGTGLGLSLAYDIITKEHNGTIRVESKEGEGTTFIIQLEV